MWPIPTITRLFPPCHDTIAKAGTLLTLHGDSMVLLSKATPPTAAGFARLTKTDVKPDKTTSLLVIFSVQA